MKIKPLAFDSLGVRSTATFVETDQKITIDPAAALGPKRYRLPPAQIEIDRLLELSKMAYLSPAYLCRFFKKVTGTTISNYVLRVRIDQAKELLIKSDLTITQIAFKIGFESHSYFDRVFYRFTKLSPKTFRQKFLPHLRR